MKNSLCSLAGKLHTLLRTAALIATLAGCVTQPQEPATHETVNATLWSLTAAEYQASARQAYQSAAYNLDLGLAQRDWSAALEQQGDSYGELPPAILMDIDQTVLDNSLYNARLATHLVEYSQETFSQWCEEQAAPAVPGAPEFIAHARSKGVTVIFYSRRIESLRDCTTKNMTALGIPVNQRYLILNNKQADTEKAYLRKQLSSQFRILLLVGDDLEDFVADSRTSPASRRALARQHADRWGRQWIVLPNPMYGAWETSIYDHDYGLTRQQKLDLKHRQLEQ